MFHHLNLFLRSLPPHPVPTIPKTETGEKRLDSTRLPNNNTHNFLRFIPHKFNEKEEQEEAKLEEKKAKWKIIPKFFCFPRIFCAGIFCVEDIFSE